MTTTAKPCKKTRRNKTGRPAGLSKALRLPVSTTTIEIGGVAYFVAPQADMEEWLEDMEDILDSVKALNEPGESIPWEDVKKEMRAKARSPKRCTGKTHTELDSAVAIHGGASRPGGIS